MTKLEKRAITWAKSMCKQYREHLLDSDLRGAIRQKYERSLIRWEKHLLTLHSRIAIQKKIIN